MPCAKFQTYVLSEIIKPVGFEEDLFCSELLGFSCCRNFLIFFLLLALDGLLSRSSYNSFSELKHSWRVASSYLQATDDFAFIEDVAEIGVY